jgi:hypothetical protein
VESRLIVGAHHPLVRFILDIANNKRSNPRRLIVLEGMRAHQQASEAALRVEHFLYCPECLRGDDAKALAGRFRRIAEQSHEMSPQAFDRISARGNGLGLVSVCRKRPVNQ